MSQASNPRKRKLLHLLASGTRSVCQPNAQKTLDSSSEPPPGPAKVSQPSLSQPSVTGSLLDDDWDDSALSDTLIAVKVAISTFPKCAATAKCIPFALTTIIQVGKPLVKMSALIERVALC
jgi:hypothetical protein